MRPRRMKNAAAHARAKAVNEEYTAPKTKAGLSNCSIGVFEISW